MVLGHVPRAPWSGAIGVHFLGMKQVAGVVVPLLQLDLPEGVYPVLQFGWQDPPCMSVLVQSPGVPLVGAADASQLALAAVLGIELLNVQ